MRCVYKWNFKPLQSMRMCDKVNMCIGSTVELFAFFCHDVADISSVSSFFPSLTSFSLHPLFILLYIFFFMRCIDNYLFRICRELHSFDVDCRIYLVYCFTHGLYSVHTLMLLLLPCSTWNAFSSKRLGWISATSQWLLISSMLIIMRGKTFC